MEQKKMVLEESADRPADKVQAAMVTCGWLNFHRSIKFIFVQGRRLGILMRAGRTVWLTPAAGRSTRTTSSPGSTRLSSTVQTTTTTTTPVTTTRISDHGHGTYPPSRDRR